MNINVSNVWYNYISNGEKTIEGRLNKGKFADLKINDKIIINNEKVMTIIKINYYNSFYDYLEKEGLKNTLPGITNINDGCNEYYKFYNKDDEKKYGIIAIHII